MAQLIAAFRMPYLYFTAFSLLLLIIVLRFLYLRLLGMFRQLRRKWNPPAPFQPEILAYFRNASFFWAIWIIPTGLLLALAIYLAQYQYLTSENVELLGVAEFGKGKVHFTSSDLKQSDHPVKGNQVAAAGLFLRFPRWMRYIGLGNYHQLIGFRGNQDTQLRYIKPKPEQLEPYIDSFLLFLYKHRDRLFIEIEYLESPYINPGKRRVLVTHKGYILE